MSSDITIHSKCFACGHENAGGLNLQFESIDEISVSCECIVPKSYQGYPGVVQGGIVATILDSAMTNCLFVLGIEAMTVRLNVKFQSPVCTEVPLRVSARLLKAKKTVYDLEAFIEQDENIKATATAKFMSVKRKAQRG